MKLITIFNFPNQENYNALCKWWVSQCLENSELNIEIWHRDSINHLELADDRIKLIKKGEIEISVMKLIVLTEIYDVTLKKLMRGI